MPPDHPSGSPVENEQAFLEFVASRSPFGHFLEWADTLEPELLDEELLPLRSDDRRLGAAKILVFGLMGLASKHAPDRHSFLKNIKEAMQRGGDDVFALMAQCTARVFLRLRDRFLKSPEALDDLLNVLAPFNRASREINADEFFQGIAEMGELTAEEAGKRMKSSLIMWIIELLPDSHDLMRDAVIANIKEVPAGSRDRLASAVRDKLRTVLARSRDETSDCQWESLDRAFIAELRSLGKRASADARTLAGKIPKRIKEGAPPWYGWWSSKAGEAPKRLRFLARLVWRDVIQPEILLEEKRRELNHEALAMPVHEKVAKLHSRAGIPSNDSRQLAFDDGSTITFDRCPLLDSDMLEVVARGIKLLGSVDAHRLLRWEVSTGYTRWLNGIEPRHVIEVERGYGELAEHLGITDKGAPQRLRAILMAQRACAFPLPGPEEGSGNLIVLSEWKGSGRRPGRIRIELGIMLMPDYTRQLARMLGSSEIERYKKLVPLVALPPFVGRERDHGPQATLSMLVTRELRWRAVELVREGGVHIGLERWAALADEARIPRSQVTQQLRPILDRWTQDGPDGPAFLKTEGKSRYTLGDAHEAARRFLIEGGKRELSGSQRGKRRARSHRARLTAG